MSSPINLNKVRKARARAEKKVRADGNALVFGLTKAQRAEAKRENARTEHALDGKTLEKADQVKAENPKTV